MKTSIKRTTSALFIAGILHSSCYASEWTSGMKVGDPSFKTMGPLSFGPNGILFVADAKSASITALATGDTDVQTDSLNMKVEALDLKIAGLLGTSPDQILINDMVVNPLSRNVYLAVSRGRGPDAEPVLVKVGAEGVPQLVSTRNVRYSRAELPDPPIDGLVGEGRRAANPRQESITDMAFHEDRVLVAGLSNEEFASTLRAVPFPFKKVADGTVVEIYHGAHGRFETRSPVRTLVPFNIGNEPHLLAAYTCTPLVQFPIKSLEPGAKVVGKTIAELGNRNRPLDMIVYQKQGKNFILMANSSRGVMKISTEEIQGIEPIKEPVTGGGTEGLPYETIEAWTGVDQLDRLDDGHALLVRRSDSGSLSLESVALP